MPVGFSPSIPPYLSQTPPTSWFRASHGVHARAYMKAWEKRAQLVRVSGCQSWRCCYCGCSIFVEQGALKHNSATREHVVAKSAGGGDGDENIVASCWGCNCQKGNLDAYQFDPGTCTRKRHKSMGNAKSLSSKKRSSYSSVDIQRLRSSMGLTQKQFGRLIGLQERSVQQIESDPCKTRKIHEQAALMVSLQEAVRQKLPHLAPPSLRAEAIALAKLVEDFTGR